ncbi:MAG: hypothetical protein Q7S85_00035 [Rugosibacter sp.]|nr:hypothetical protein [Rugosibacter sp.]
MKTIKTEDKVFVEDEFGAFEEEVLNAGWIPPLENPALAERRAEEPTARAADELVFDTDAFLNLVYSNQQ